MSVKILVAGVGNIFLGDDGFGVAVARQLAGESLPEGVAVEDFGIRGVHLAYQLLDGYDALILIDAVARGGAPGTLYVIEPNLDDLPATSPADAHGLEPQAVLGMVKQLGGSIDRVRIIGCEVAEIVERIGLSDVVERAVPDAARLVHRVLHNVAPASVPGSARSALSVELARSQPPFGRLPGTEAGATHGGRGYGRMTNERMTEEEE